jgi:hypothetical protein
MCHPEKDLLREVSFRHSCCFSSGELHLALLAAFSDLKGNHLQANSFLFSRKKIKRKWRVGFLKNLGLYLRAPGNLYNQDCSLFLWHPQGHKSGTVFFKAQIQTMAFPAYILAQPGVLPDQLLSISQIWSLPMDCSQCIFCKQSLSISMCISGY